MSSYKQQLAALHKAIIEKDFSQILPLTKLSRHNEISTEARVNIYAKGYHIRLIEATYSDFPALSHLIGEDALREHITAFTHATPSKSWDLNLYPAHFAKFFAQNSSDKAAIALCKLEAAISHVYWQPQSKTLSAETIAALDEEAFGNTHFKLHTASQILSLTADAESYLSAFRDDLPLDVMALQPQYVLVIRPEKQVMRYLLDKDEFDLLTAIESGKSFNEALATINNQSQLATKLPTYLAQWFEHQIFCDATI